MEIKKVFAIIVLVPALLISMTACGENNTKQENTGQAATTTAAEKPVELTVPFLLIAQAPKEIGLVQEELNEYLKDKINATVEFMPISSAAYAQQIRLMLAGQEKIDLMANGTLGNGNVFDYANQVSNGQLHPMDDLLDQYGQGIKDALGDYINIASFNGKIYAVPTLRDMAKAESIAMRKDIIEKHNIDTGSIQKFTDIEPILKLIKEKEPNMTPYQYGQDSKGDIIDTMSYLMRGDHLGDWMGVLMDMSEPSLEVVNLYETPEYISAVELARKWYLAGYVSPNAATNTDMAQSFIKSGKLFSYMQPWKPGIDAQVTKQCETPMICVKFNEGYVTTGNVTNFMWVIPNHAGNPDKSMEFLNLMYSDPYVVNLIDWGIEGKHYVKTDDGTIDYPEGVNATNTGYALNAGFEFGNQFLSYVWKGDSPNIWTEMDGFNKSAQKSSALGFMFNQSSVKSEVAAINTVFNQYQRALETGSIDPEVYLPEFRKGLKDAGIDKVIAEKQKQLDEWAASMGLKK